MRQVSDKHLIMATKINHLFPPILMIYPCEFDCNQPIYSLGRTQTYNAIANTDTNRIRNKNNMSPTPFGWEHNLNDKKMPIYSFP